MDARVTFVSADCITDSLKNCYPYVAVYADGRISVIACKRSVDYGGKCKCRETGHYSYALMKPGDLYYEDTIAQAFIGVRDFEIVTAANKHPMIPAGDDAKNVTKFTNLCVMENFAPGTELQAL